MKKLLLLLVSSAFVMLIGCGNKNGYTIKGDIAGLEGKVVLMDSEGMEVNSADVVNGTFDMQGTLEKPMVVSLSDEQGIFAQIIILEKGTIKVKGEITEDEEGYYSQNIEVTGTPANNAFTKYSISEKELYGALDADNFNDEVYEQLSSDIRDLAHASFEKNKNNFAGVLMLHKLFMAEESPSRILEAIEMMPAEFKAEESVESIRSFAEQAKRTEIGQPYIEIALPGLDGETISLSDHIGEGKYVLIDFWATWCGPCMAEVPYLVEAYDKFHNLGFEIFGVAVNDNDTRWKNVINEKQMNWVHVFATANDQAPVDYAVRGIPANFLVNPDGKIIARNLRGEQLDAKLAEIFKN